MSGAKIRSPFLSGRRTERRAEAITQKLVVTSVPNASRAARMLALAHHVERLIEAGELESYAEAASVLGLTRTRLTQVMNLLLLAPSLQGALLMGARTCSERGLREVVAEPCWDRQQGCLWGRVNPTTHGGHDLGGG